LGQGGTGKSMLIGAITETFKFYGQENILAKCATTGIAATDIGGQTLHSWAGIQIRRKKNDETGDRSGKGGQKKRRKNMEGKHFLIIDEISMANKKLLYSASEAVLKCRGEQGIGSAEEPFGSMHVILAGDLHQFPPVGNSATALYVDNLSKDTRDELLGREIFKQFETVVILKEQIRVKDKIWMGILNRLRIGQCSGDDIDTIRKLVLPNEECDIPDFSKRPWSEATLITARHGVKDEWNYQAVRKHCKTTGNVKYVAPAQDINRETGEEPSAEARLAIAKKAAEDTGNLEDNIDLAVGMKAMIQANISVEASIANGTRGVIEEIILDPLEDAVHEIDEDGVVRLKYPPAMVLFRPNNPTSIRFPGIPEGLIPLTPTKATFTVEGRDGKKHKIARKQYPLVPGYAFTDYKSQGQTIECVIIDIGKPLFGHLSPFGVYVALSRSRGRETIRLLRDFDDKLFQNHPSEELRIEMERLEALDKDDLARRNEV